VAFPAAWWSAEDHRRDSTAHPPDGGREFRRGALKIHGAPLEIGFVVSERTVARYLRRIRRREDPAKRWLAFLQDHRKAIVACDFFAVPGIAFKLLC